MLSIMGYCRKPGQTGLRYAGAMHPFSELADLTRRLQQQALRDLAWTLTSPALLLDAGIAQRHPLAGSHWADHPERLGAWLTHLDQQPEPLLQWLHSSHNQRLGHYYERLWQFALQRAPGIRLLAANLPIRQGQLTLGELDLLLEDRDGLHHLELAVKFYLGLEHGDRSRHDHWLGPGSQDRLDIKLQRICEHQLQICSTACAQSVLSELTCEAIDSAFWLGGYLFQPWNADPKSPAGANPEHLKGYWLRQRDWPAFLSHHPNTRWQPQPRHVWLAPARLETAAIWQASDFDNWISEATTRSQARLLARMEADEKAIWTEQERLFLVPDGWPD